jgi:hypothetical protein
MIKVLGVDLAYTDWDNNGSATLSFDGNGWVACNPGVVGWLAGPITPVAMARTINAFAIENKVAAVSLDGPQGWRTPNAPQTLYRLFPAGRICEYETMTPGHTGTYGAAQPANWAHMAHFCVSLFDQLLASGNAVLVNDANARYFPPLEEGKYYILECFPTSTWITSGLRKLGGHDTPPNEIQQFAANLFRAYRIPNVPPFAGSHDDLQAVVAALPAAALLGGPCWPLPNGTSALMAPADEHFPQHRIEGLIWDACTPKAPRRRKATRPAPPPAIGQNRPQLNVGARCPIPGCNHIFANGRSGWDGHVSNRTHRVNYHPEVQDHEERMELFRGEFPDFFA